MQLLTDFKNWSSSILIRKFKNIAFIIWIRTQTHQKQVLSPNLYKSYFKRNVCLPRTTNSAPSEIKESLNKNEVGVTWHCQTPSSNSRLASKILKEQSPSSGLPAHSYLVGYMPTGSPSFSHRHSPFLFCIKHGITKAPWGFISWYRGCSVHCWMAVALWLSKILKISNFMLTHTCEQLNAQTQTKEDVYGPPSEGLHSLTRVDCQTAFGATLRRLLQPA